MGLFFVPGKSQQVLHDFGNAVGFAEDLPGELRGRVRLIHSVQDQLGIVHDTVDGIVDFMGYPAGQGPEGFDLL